MSEFAPITIVAIDNDGHGLFEYSVPFRIKITARQALEAAFTLAQTASKPNPFSYTLEFFGYSEFAQDPGYLGYEVDSINSIANTSEFFWELLVNNVESQSGADTTYPLTGSTVAWIYTAIPTNPADLTHRSGAILQRRAARTLNLALCEVIGHEPARVAARLIVSSTPRPFDYGTTS